MIDCTCICDYGDNPPEWYDSQVRIARKAHVCDECMRVIEPNEKYVRSVGVWEGDFAIFKHCAECDAIGRDFFCECWGHGNLWNNMREHHSFDRNELPDTLLEFWDKQKAEREGRRRTK